MRPKKEKEKKRKEKKNARMKFDKKDLFLSGRCCA
jgi:hypothetical protein